MPELVIAPAEFLCGNATPQLIIASSMLLAIRTTLALGKIGCPRPCHRGLPQDDDLHAQL
jgi:hypothetical protein